MMMKPPRAGRMWLTLRHSARLRLQSISELQIQFWMHCALLPGHQILHGVSPCRRVCRRSLPQRSVVIWEPCTSGCVRVEMSV